MTLGHWYLVVPKLSEKPLLIVNIIIWIILGIKIPISIKSLIAHKEFFEEFTTLGSGYAFNLVLLTMRLSFGYLVILIMSIFNWRLLKLRSIQSSTGVMYAMTFFVFIGEMISAYLFFNYGMHI
jgi:DMSO reductase anchor subunit